MLYSKQHMVRLLAGSTLATFAYNNLATQKDISNEGGLRFKCFVPFLQSPDEYHRCIAAFQVSVVILFLNPSHVFDIFSMFLFIFIFIQQVVILARIIKDEEQSISSAAGIKLIAELLQTSKSNDILALAADCVARLTHTRAGKGKSKVY